MTTAHRSSEFNILVVDDSPTDMLLMQEAFGDNVRTFGVSDGMEAIAFLSREEQYASAPVPNLVLLDLHLPRVDGKTVLKRVKSDPRLRSIPIVVISGSASQEEMEASYAEHANCFVLKPREFSEYKDMMASISAFWRNTATLPSPACNAVSPQTATVSPTADPCLEVLLIEDSPSDALLIKQGLDNYPGMSFRVTTVERCEAAVRHLRTGKFHVVLTDLGLPDKQGTDTLQAIRTAAQNLPIIVLTGSTDESVGAKALRLGASDYLVKNEVAGNAVARAIRYCVERSRLEQQVLHTNKLEAVGQLAGGVAHDFNNLLTIMQGNAALMLEREDLPADLREATGEIVSAADRAANLTRQLLTFSRRQPMRRAALCPNQTVTDVMRMLNRLLGEHIDVRMSLAASRKIHADRGMVEQVLMNLALNGRDAMRVGGVLAVTTDDVVGRTFPETAGHHFVRMTVADTGCGIRTEHLAHIFEPFFTTKDIGKGTGLGLATVYGIVKQHGGAIEVKSVLNQGTTFEVYWPLAADEPARESAPAAHAERGEGQTILVVEDEADLRRLLAFTLERHGYCVVPSASGKEALELWRADRGRFSVIVTDVMMPGGVSGADLVREIRRASDNTPLVLTSGYSPELLRSEGWLTGTEEILMKPFTPATLLAVIHAAIAPKV